MGGVWLARVVQDVRYALRQLRRALGFAVTVVMTLALGLGTAVSMYTVVDRVMLRPLPYRDAGSLVQITEVGKDGEPRWETGFLDITEWQARSRTLASIAYYDVEGGPAHLDFLEGKDGSIGVANGTVSARISFPCLACMRRWVARSWKERMVPRHRRMPMRFC